MNIRQLEAFKAVMELGSFTRAGQRLGLSQPAISKLILLLEHASGFALFHRQKNGVVATAEGRMLYSEVKRVFLGIDSVSARAKAIRRLDYGELRLAAFPSLAARVLPSIIASFLEARPAVHLEMFNRNSWLLLDRVATQGIDVGFGMVTDSRPGLRFERLCGMQAVCVLPPGHRLEDRDVIDAADLHRERFVGMLEEDRAQFQVDEAFAARRVERDMALKAQSTEACCSFVAAGCGVSVVDPLSTVGFDGRDLLVRPFRPIVSYDIWTVFPSFKQPSLGTLALVAHVQEHLPRRLRGIEADIVGGRRSGHA